MAAAEKAAEEREAKLQQEDQRQAEEGGSPLMLPSGL